MIIPAMELRGGKVVTALADGGYHEYDDDPVELARALYRLGEIVVIDLDAAQDTGDNLDLIREICRVAECRVGGGIRDERRGDRLLRAGAKQLLVGTGADADLLARFPRKKVLVVMDIQDGRVVRRGWSEETDIDPVELALRLQEHCAGFIYTLVGHRVRMEHQEVQRFEQLKSALPEHRLTAAGGFATVDDLRELDRMGVDGQLTYGQSPCGTNLAVAFVAVLDFEKSSGLVPVVVQDSVGQVLSLMHANRDAVLMSVQTGMATYWSAGQGKIFTKGQSSGNTQDVITVRPDCTRGALLFTVKPSGPSCHLGRYSCFDDLSYNLHRIEQLMQARKSGEDPHKSYTQLMLADHKAIKERIGQEAAALEAAATRDEVLWETADLLYFVLLNLVNEGLSLDDVNRELRGRAGRRRS
jgi:phosphoribosyl-ATP pyrophosphohydrolase/phosphoribosyl-AMP cyclohydrolase